MRWNNDQTLWRTVLQLLSETGDFASRCSTVGVLTGRASGGLLAVDFDEPANSKGGESQAAFEALTGHPSTDLPLSATRSVADRGDARSGTGLARSGGSCSREVG